MKRYLVLMGMLLMLGGCHWKAQAEDWKQKFVEECRLHYQTQMIKSAEIADLNRQIDQLKAENTGLKNQLAGPRPPEAK